MRQIADRFADTVGGIEQVIRQMCVGTGRLGVTNTVLSLSREKNLRPISFEGHTVHRVPLDFEIASNACSVASLGALARLAREADVVVTMGCGDACPVYPGKKYLDWELMDPAGQEIEIVRSIRDDILLRVQALVSELL